MQAVTDWLRSLGLERYERLFAENFVDADILRDLTDVDLEKIGVPLGHRKKMLRAIAELARAPPLAPLAPIGVIPTVQNNAEHRQLTVMFVDLVGSTAMSTKLDPEDLRGIINAYHRCCTEFIQRNGGFVAKYMGDGVLAYFGYPKAHEHDAEHAVRAALTLVEAVPKLVTKAGSALQVRVGIGTGLVVVGDLIGTGAAQEQAVVGETPNLAARLQALAEPGAVVISGNTRRLTGGLFEYRDLGVVPLKGFSEDIRAWQVTGIGTTESRFEALRTTTTPLVGREEEIDLLLRRWEQAKCDEGQVVLVSGEPGIGKSRIAQTIMERIAAEPHTRLRYFCSPHHRDSALYPSITQLERAAGFRREDSSEQRLAKLEAVLSQATDDLSEAVPLLADLLAIPTGDRYPQLGLTPQKQKEKTLRALIGQVEGLSARQPVLMVFEDVHWADPSSRESLDLLIERVATLRVLAIVTFRPEFTPPWIGRPHVTFVTLNRLPLRQRAEIIVHVTGGKGLPKEITDQIAERTDGVPLFIEELTKTVVESGMVADAMAAPFAIPTSLHASLLARLDRLASTREIAQIGAALGRSFSHELISAVAPMPQQQVDDALAQLVSAELIFCRGTPPDAEYTFKHALVRDAAYSTLLRSRRQQIHAQIAPTLENRFPESAVAQPELMAHHCSEAGLAEKAAAYWLRAGKLSVKRSAVAEAEAQLRRGLGALLGLPDGDDRRQLELELQIALGRAQMASRGFGSRDVGETYARARLLAEQLDRSGYISQLLYGSWVLHTVRGEHKTALSHAVQLEQIGWDRHDTALRLMGLCLQSGSRYHFGEFVAAIALAQQCDGLSDHRAIYAPQTADDMHTILLACVAVMLTVLGHIDQGRARMSDALSQAKQLGHKYTLAQVPNYYCRIDWMIDLPNEMERHAAESEAISIEQGFSYCSAVATYFRGFARAALDGPKDGLALLERGLSAMRATGTVVGTPTVMMMMAETYNRLGDSVESANCLLEAVRIIETTGERMVEAEVHRVWGDMLVASGDAAGAEQRYKRAVHVAQDQNAKLYELRTAKSLARLLRDQGRRTEAHDLLATVYNWFTEGFDTPVLKEAKALLDELAA